MPLSIYTIKNDDNINTIKQTEMKYYNFLKMFMLKSKGLVSKYLSLNAKVPVQNFNNKVRNEIFTILSKEEKFNNFNSHITKIDAFKRCCKLLEQFEQAAFLITLQLNKRFWIFCKLKELECKILNKKSIKRDRSVSPQRNRSKSRSKYRSRSRSRSRSKSRSRSRSITKSRLQPLSESMICISEI